MKKMFCIFMLFITMLLVNACRLSSNTNNVSSNIVASETAEVISTETETQTPTVIPTDNTDQVDTEYFGNGFSYKPIEGFEMITVEPTDSITMSIFHNEEATISFYVFGETDNSQFESYEDVVIYWMNLLANNDQIWLAPQEAHEIIVDGYETLLIDLEGESMGKPAYGNVVAVLVSDSQYFMALCFAEDEHAEDLWRDEGKPAMDLLLSSVNFMEME